MSLRPAARRIVNIETLHRFANTGKVNIVCSVCSIIVVITPVCSHLYWTEQKASRTMCDVAINKKRQLRGETGRAGLGNYKPTRLLRRLNELNDLKTGAVIPYWTGAPDLRVAGPSENLSRVLDIIAELNEIGATTPTASATVSIYVPENTPERIITIDNTQYTLLSAPTHLDELEQELNKRMERYTSHPTFRFRKGRLLVGYSLAVGRDGRVSDTAIVPMMIDALRAGDLQKLARCQFPDCRRWFLKRVGGQRFCPTPAKCRQKAFEDTSEFRAERAKYMQWWRWQDQNEGKKISYSEWLELKSEVRAELLRQKNKKVVTKTSKPKHKGKKR
jgi:hypothetical protein